MTHAGGFSTATRRTGRRSVPQRSGDRAGTAPQVRPRALGGLIVCFILGAATVALEAHTPELPAAFWSFKECPSGIAKDGSPGSSCAELRNGAACVWLYEWVDNEDNPLGGRAAKFDGLDDVAVVPDGPRLEFTRQLTVTAWIKPLRLSGDHTVISQGAEPAPFAVQIAGGRVAVTLAFSDGAMVSATTQEEVAQDAWTHLAVVLSGGCDIRVFLDGEEAELMLSGASCDQVSQSILQQSDEPLSIGNDTGGHGFEGLIDEIRLYSQALHADDIRVLAGLMSWNWQALFYFGGDTNFGGDAGDYPEGTPGPHFYLGQIGGYDIDCEIYYRGRNVMDAGDVVEEGDPQCQFNAQMAFNVGDRKTYAYWILRGPEVKPDGTTPLQWGRHEALRAISRWNDFHDKVDPELSKLFDDKTLKNRRLLKTKLLFADIEPGRGGSLVDDGWPDCWLELEGCNAVTRQQNRQVVEGFLRQLADDGFTPGIYTSNGAWSGFFGPDFVPTRRGRPLPFVLWLSSCSTTEDDPARSPELLARYFPTVRENALGGMRPVLWQYHIEGPDLDVTIQRPDKLTPLPAIDILGSPATSSCTCGHLPAGSCAGIEACGPWEGPEWSSPDGVTQIEYDFNDEAAFDLGIIPNVASTNPELYQGLVFGGATLKSLDPNYPESDSALDLDGETAWVQAEDSGDIAFSYGVAVEAWVWREANDDEDAIASKWFGPDQWLLSFASLGEGKLDFTVHTRDGNYHRVEYWLPDTGYLQRWVHVAASYEVIGGRLRLYFDGRLVAEETVEGDSPDAYFLYHTLVPVHVGTAGAPVWWSRFKGMIDNVRIWIIEAPDFD